MSADVETTTSRTHADPLRAHATMDAIAEESKAQPSGAAMTTDPEYPPGCCEKEIDTPPLETGTTIIISPVNGTHLPRQLTVFDPNDAVKPSTSVRDREG